MLRQYMKPYSSLYAKGYKYVPKKQKRCLLRKKITAYLSDIGFAIRIFPKKKTRQLQKHTSFLNY